MKKISMITAVSILFLLFSMLATDSIFAKVGTDCQCFNETAAWTQCGEWCDFYRGVRCDDVLPFYCYCLGTSCSCRFWAVCEDGYYKKLSLTTPCSSQCEDW